MALVKVIRANSISQEIRACMAWRPFFASNRPIPAGTVASLEGSEGSIPDWCPLENE